VNGPIKMVFGTVVLGAGLSATGVAAVVALGVGLATTVWAAQVERVQQDPAVHGNLNKCWGQVASQTAKLGRDDDIPGGGLGSHSRSTQAANNVGGFANSENGFGIQFNVDGGRKGVGNFSAQTAETGGPHHTAPGDGGNGVHAMNNAAAATTLNPVNGQFTTAAGGTAEVVDLGCVP
jgi:hypothetical protein